jgi:CheY-like chemotaxis protein
MPSPEPTSAVPPLRILFVDDEAPLRLAVAAVLRASGHLVETANDGTEGLRKLTDAVTKLRSPFDLLITDLEMPAMDGLTLIQMLRETNLPIRIVVYSSSLWPHRIKQLNILSVDAMIEKGGPEDRLFETVTSIARSRAEGRSPA